VKWIRTPRLKAAWVHSRYLWHKSVQCFVSLVRYQLQLLKNGYVRPFGMINSAIQCAMSALLTMAVRRGCASICSCALSLTQHRIISTVLQLHVRSSPTRSLPSSPHKPKMASSATISEVPAALGSLDPRSFTPHSPPVYTRWLVAKYLRIDIAAE
jgi:hypothetical protein